MTDQHEQQTQRQTISNEFLEEVLNIKVPPLPIDLDKKLRRQMLRETLNSFMWQLSKGWIP